jgi:hypothetical protein
VKATFRHVAVAVVAGLIAAVSATTASATLRTPAQLPPSCMRDSVRAAACQLIVEFFGAVNGGRYARACSLLGERLLRETGGSNCPKWLASSGQTRFQVLRARTAPVGVQVLVKVELPELDHVRMLNWGALVGPEDGWLRILETRR